MTIHRIRHITTYHYARPVSLGSHRLMLRPRESRDVRLLAAELTIQPEATLTWSQDVFDNAVATATFEESTDRLVIDSFAKIDLRADPWPVFDIAASAINYPFSYSDHDWIDLGALTILQHPDTERLGAWARGFVRGERTDTLSLLKDLSEGVTRSATYEVRDDEGTQTPIETLDLGSGSCRDLAVLYAEAARSLGFGARIVSGYLYNQGGLIGSSDAGSTHAWAEIYLPGAGWITFDPTNRSLGGRNLIPVGVGRDIWQIMPVSGSYVGVPDALLEMSVSVQVTSE